MLLSYHKNFVFIKGIKVAGTSIEVHLAPQLELDAIVTPIIPKGPDSHVPRNYRIDGVDRFFNHMTASNVIDLIGESEWVGLQSWGVARHPHEKIMSFYFMNYQRQGTHYTLDDAIEQCSSEAERYCGADGSQLVARIFRYEEIATVLPSFIASLGLEGEGLSNVREKGDYRKAYDGPEVSFNTDQIARIEQKFAFDLGLYEDSGITAR